MNTTPARSSLPTAGQEDLDLRLEVTVEKYGSPRDDSGDFQDCISATTGTAFAMQSGACVPSHAMYQPAQTFRTADVLLEMGGMKGGYASSEASCESEKFTLPTQHVMDLRQFVHHSSGSSSSSSTTAALPGDSARVPSVAATTAPATQSNASVQAESESDALLDTIAARGLLRALYAEESQHHRQQHTAPDDVEEARPIPITAEALQVRQERLEETEEWAAARHFVLDQLRAELDGFSYPKTSTMSAVVETQEPATPEKAISQYRLSNESTRTGDAEAHAGALDRTPSPMKDSGLVARGVVAAGGTSGFQPNISSISNISPVKNTMQSILAEMYGTPTPPDRKAWRQRGTEDDQATPHRHHSRENNSPDRLQSGPQRMRSPVTPEKEGYSVYSPSREQDAGQGTCTSGNQSHFIEEKVRRQQKLRRELDAKEMAECTFHPSISPGTRAMIRQEYTSHREETAAAAEEWARAGGQMQGSRALNDTSLPLTMRSVYDRLYPEKLADASAKKQRVELENARRQLVRAEMTALRAHCKAPFRKETNESSFDVFISNVLGSDCRRATVEELHEGGIVLASSYRSPMAVALAEERVARRRLAERRRAEGLDRSGGGTTEPQPYRIALFDEFLMRQNTHYYRRAKTVRELEESMTPEFTPQTNASSAKMVKSMVERSRLNDSSDQSRSMQSDRSKGVPVTGELVKKHKSPYVDPCTFKPEVSQLAKDQHGSVRGGRCRFTHLYEDHKRAERTRAEAKERAERDELVGYSFKPTNLNESKNVRVESMLDPKNYAQYEQYLRAKKEELQQRKVESDSKTERKEVSLCTFKPAVSKKPAYISTMAKNFGILREQNKEF